MNRIALFLAALSATAVVGGATAAEQKNAAKPGEPKIFPTGYSDTPVIPGTKWKVHDIDRPHPPRVMPGAKLGDAPADAIVLFDGKSSEAFYTKDKDTGEVKPCPWELKDGTLHVTGGDCWTKQEFASCQFHIEWMSDPKTEGNSQKKGNGGVFFMDRYECQMLDTHNNPTYADGMTGCIYGQTPPLVNAVRPPGQWQAYDIVFTAPELDKEGKVVKPAFVTTFVNGVCVQVHTEIMGPTQHKKTTNYEGVFPAKAPIRLQDHKNNPPIQVRNIWIRPLE
ncbi:MAG: DUF1080 domain-containing protein [Verrucomicrobiales bacterium]|nr:DUF1080 domain-containing protein [Verrucomicrobiales bacterium]